jgi:hypothetical protein
MFGTGGYTHAKGFWVDTPELNIIGWAKPPTTPRPVLPPIPPLPLSLLAPTETVLNKEDEEVPFS